MNVPTFGICIFADDVARTASFYVDHFECEQRMDLGWFATLGHGDSPYEFAVTARDHESLPAGHRKHPSGVMVVVIVDDAVAKAHELEAANIPFVTALKDEPWGQRHFVVPDLAR